MQASELRVGQSENGLVSVNNRAIEEPEIGLIGVGAEGEPARSYLRQSFHGVDHRDILLGLVFENAQLGCAIIGHRVIAIEMVRREVKPEAD